MPSIFSKVILFSYKSVLTLLIRVFLVKLTSHIIQEHIKSLQLKFIQIIGENQKQNLNRKFKQKITATRVYSNTKRTSKTEFKQNLIPLLNQN